MFQGTNYTEASASFESLDVLQKGATMMADVLRDMPEESRDAFLADFIQRSYMDRRGLTPEDMPSEGFRDEEHMAVWTMLSNRAHWFGRWGDLAFPRIQMSHSFAAQLMATTLSPKEIPNIEAPWPAFLVEVPEGLLPISLRDGQTTYITRIHVNTSFLPSLWDQPWWGLEFSGKGLEIHRVGQIAEAFDQSSPREVKKRRLIQSLPEEFRTQPKDEPLGDNYDDFWTGYDRSAEDRVSILAARLALGACIMMTDKANYRVKEARLEPTLAFHRRRTNKEPVSRIYVVGQPVKVDFRMVVQQFISGSLRSLSVQSLVCGHHKSQPHGPGNALRKWIFVEPYWRGPEAGPIVVRPHMVDRE